MGSLLIIIPNLKHYSISVAKSSFNYQIETKSAHPLSVDKDPVTKQRKFGHG